MTENKDRLPIPRIEDVPKNMIEEAIQINDGEANVYHYIDDPKWSKYLSPYWIEHIRKGVEFWEHIINIYGRNGKLEIPQLLYRVLPEGELGLYHRIENSVSVDVGAHTNMVDDFLKTHLHEFRHYNQAEWRWQIKPYWLWFFKNLRYPFQRIVDAIDWFIHKHPAEYDAIRFEEKEYVKVIGYKKFKKPKYSAFRKEDEND